MQTRLLTASQPLLHCRGACPCSLLQHRSTGAAVRRVQTVSNAASGAAGYPADSSGSGADAQPLKPASSSSNEAAAGGTPEKKTVWQKIKHFFVGEKLDKERLKALGMGAFASYGVISNLNYGTALTMAWLAFVKLNGVAPTAPGQWPSFLAFYAGFWAVQNFVRPLRISLALALAPAFDKAITQLGEKLNIPKGWAFGIFIVSIGIITSSILFSTIYLLGGFPSNTVPIKAAA